MSDYDVLKAYGHSPAKAAEIVLDAKRGDSFCQRYIAFVHDAAQGIEARQRTDPEEGLDPKGESAVNEVDAPVIGPKGVSDDVSE